ncbi:MAG: DNA-primase RepB domain-containing protein [Bacillota bacterium]|nr:DNA-primase RepB domain-containing protein [Bacillota bacterium]
MSTAARDLSTGPSTPAPQAAGQAASAPSDADALALLRLLYDQPGVAGHLEIRLIPEGGGRPEQRFFPLPEGVGAAARFALSMSGRAHVFFGVYPRSRPRGRDDDVAAATCLFADLDAKDFPGGAVEIDRNLAEVAEKGLAPTAVVASGGGRHAYWLLRRPVPLGAPDDPQRGRVRAALWALGAELGLSPGANVVHDLARVLRLPGTLNIKAKYGTPAPARILALDPSRVYRPADFADVIRRHPMPVPAADAAGRRVGVRFTRPPRADVPLDTLLAGLHLPEWALELIRRPIPRGLRSEPAFRAVRILLRSGADPDLIRDVFACPESGGVGDAYRERQARRDGDRWLARTIARAMASLESDAGGRAGGRRAGRGPGGAPRYVRELERLNPADQVAAVLLDGVPAELRAEADREGWPDERSRARAAEEIARACLRAGMAPAAAYLALTVHAVGLGKDPQTVSRWVRAAERAVAGARRGLGRTGRGSEREGGIGDVGSAGRRADGPAAGGAG